MEVFAPFTIGSIQEYSHIHLAQGPLSIIELLMIAYLEEGSYPLALDLESHGENFRSVESELLAQS